MRPLITDDTTELLLAQLFQTDWGVFFFFHSDLSRSGKQLWWATAAAPLLQTSHTLPRTAPTYKHQPHNPRAHHPLPQGIPPFLSRPGWSWTAALPWEPLASKRAGNHGTELSGPIRKPTGLLTVPHKCFLQEITLGCFGTVLLCKKNWPLLGFQEGKFKWCQNTF